MKLLVETNQGVEYINKPLSELIANKEVIIHTNYFGPDFLDFWLTDPLFLRLLKDNSAYKNRSVCHCRGAYFRYNVRDKSFTNLHTNYLVSTSDSGGADGEGVCGGYLILFTIGERMILRKLTTIMWLKVLAIRVRGTCWKLWDSLRVSKR